jgi:hypothetical protein
MLIRKRYASLLRRRAALTLPDAIWIAAHCSRAHSTLCLWRVDIYKWKGICVYIWSSRDVSLSLSLSLSLCTQHGCEASYRLVRQIARRRNNFFNAARTSLLVHARSAVSLHLSLPFSRSFFLLGALNSLLSRASKYCQWPNIPCEHARSVGLPNSNDVTILKKSPRGIRAV